jgi:hypothetical protein
MPTTVKVVLDELKNRKNTDSRKPRKKCLSCVERLGEMEEG